MKTNRIITMHSVQTTVARPLLFVGLIAWLASASACGQKDDIRVYAAPAAPAAAAPPARPAAAPANAPAAAPPSPHGAAAGEARLLAAIVARGDEVWHFMLMGPADEVAKQRDTVLQVIQDLKFVEKEQDGRKRLLPTWHIPPGWQEKPGTGFRFATLVTGETGKGLELRITPLGAESAEPMSNMQRYAGMVGLRDAKEEELKAAAKTIKVDGKDAVWIELKGPGAGAGAGRPPFAKPQPEAVVREKLVTKAPLGWKEPAQLPPFAVAAYEIVEGEQKASLSVSKVGGDLGANINRWRTQVGLTEWTQEEFRESAAGGKGIDIGAAGGRLAILIDFLGPQSAGAKRERILGAIVAGSGGEDIWYLKVRGPAELVGKQKDAFDGFLKNVKFEEEK